GVDPVEPLGELVERQPALGEVVAERVRRLLALCVRGPDFGGGVVRHVVQSHRDRGGCPLVRGTGLRGQDADQGLGGWSPAATPVCSSYSSPPSLRPRCWLVPPPRPSSSTGTRRTSASP